MNEMIKNVITLLFLYSNVMLFKFRLMKMMDSYEDCQPISLSALGNFMTFDKCSTVYFSSPTYALPNFPRWRQAPTGSCTNRLLMSFIQEVFCSPPHAAPKAPRRREAPTGGGVLSVQYTHLPLCVCVCVYVCM